MAEYVSRRARAGQHHDDVAVDLRADVWRERWPPYTPPQGWSECVNAHRAVSGNVRRGLNDEVQFMVLRCCGRYEAIREWSSAVRYWARRIEQQELSVVFLEFMSVENWSALPQPFSDGVVGTAAASAEIHRSTARADERASWQQQVCFVKP